VSSPTQMYCVGGPFGDKGGFCGFVGGVVLVGVCGWDCVVCSLVGFFLLLFLFLCLLFFGCVDVFFFLSVLFFGCVFCVGGGCGELWCLGCGFFVVVWVVFFLWFLVGFGSFLALQGVGFFLIGFCFGCLCG